MFRFLFHVLVDNLLFLSLIPVHHLPSPKTSPKTIPEEREGNQLVFLLSQTLFFRLQCGKQDTDYLKENGMKSGPGITWETKDATRIAIKTLLQLFFKKRESLESFVFVKRLPLSCLCVLCFSENAKL